MIALQVRRLKWEQRQHQSNIGASSAGTEHVTRANECGYYNGETWTPQLNAADSDLRWEIIIEREPTRMIRIPGELTFDC